MNIIYTVYKIGYQNNIVYVGATSKRLKERLQEHYNNPKSAIYAILHKYGKDSFSIEPIIEDIEDKNEAHWLEEEYTKLYRTNQPIFNINNGDMLGEETKAKIAVANINEKNPNAKPVYNHKDKRMFKTVNDCRRFYKLSQYKFYKLLHKKAYDTRFDFEILK